MSQQQRTVLIVDDSPEDRELYRRYLQRDDEYCYTLVEANLGREGLELWQRYQPDVVLLDYRLPDLDGLKFLAQLQTQTSQSFLPVIVVTGQGNEAIAVQAIKAGAQDYLVKGQITPDNLRLAVNGTIETVQLRTQLQQRIERERLLTQITQQIRQSLNLQEILQTTVTEVRQFLQTDRIIIFQLESDGNGSVIAESVGVQWRSLLSSTIYDPCLAENYVERHSQGLVTYDPCFVENYVERYRQGLVKAKTDIYDGSIDPCHVELLAQVQVRANLVVPILHENQLWGLLIAHHCAAPRQWQSLEIELLQQLTTQVSVAIRQAELYQQTQLELAERKRAEEALRDSEERLRLALEAARMGAWDWNILTGQIQWSANLEDLFGLAPGEFDGSYKMFVSSLHPEDRDRVLAAINDSVTTGADYYIEFRVVYPNGRIRWALTQGKVFYDQTGQPVRMAGIDLDITERKQAEEALHRSEERYRTLFESIDEGFCLIEMLFDEDNMPLDYRFLAVNPAFETQSGLKQAEGKTIRQLAPEIEDHWFEIYGKVAITGEPIRFQNGSEALNRWFDVYAFHLGQGSSRKVAILFKDISDRKQIEEALRQSEEFKQRVLESSSDCIKVLDLDGRLLYMNGGGMSLLEIDDLTPYLHAEWVCFWQAEDQPGAEAAMAAAKAGELGKFQGFCPTAKGTPKWWDVVVTPIRDAAGQVVQLLSVSRDITDAKHAEQALRQSEARYRYLAEAIPQLVWTCDANGFTNYVSQRLCDYIGLTREQALGNSWLSSVHPDDVQSTQEAWITATEQGIFYRHEYRFKRGADGSYRWHLALGLPLKDEQGQVVKWFGTCTDIHDQKELEVERDRIFQLEQAAREEAERANRIKDEFLAVLSHELRSPLNPILGWTKLLQTRKFDATKTAEALATIERNAKLQTQLIDDLLDVARILRGKLSLNAAPVNLTVVIEAAIDTVRTAAVAKSILIHPVLPNIGQVSGDSVRLQQIVWNLLSNAIKFTPKGGRVEICVERVGDQAQITVTDTGKGINPDFLPYIFESFRQEDVSVTRKYGGLGLGLAIVRHLVEAHGGIISADSSGEGLGAIFTVRLPLLNIEPDMNQADELLEHELNLTGIRVLTIDDEPDTRELLTILLAEYGAQVMTVASSTEFLAALESFQPDVLVSDIGMPEVDGYTLLRQVRSLRSERSNQIPAIALSAYAGEIDQQQALAAGFHRHLAKPIEPHQLVQAVAKLIDKRN